MINGQIYYRQDFCWAVKIYGGGILTPSKKKGQMSISYGNQMFSRLNMSVLEQLQLIYFCVFHSCKVEPLQMKDSMIQPFILYSMLIFFLTLIGRQLVIHFQIFVLVFQLSNDLNYFIVITVTPNNFFVTIHFFYQTKEI